MNPIMNFGRYLFLERPARKKTLAAWGETIDQNGEELTQKLSETGDSEQNRRVLSHVIGIEKWGQSRLKVALGEPFQRDEYDEYRPPKSRTWEQLKAEFKATRRQTVALAKRMDRGEVADYSMKILHNQFGDLSLQGWLRYLDMHANWEFKKMK